jgi:undecaprenyl-diphosphatase
MLERSSAWVTSIWHHLRKRDREELFVLAGVLVLVGSLLVVINLAGEVLEGDTQDIDERLLSALRKADDPASPIGPRWLEQVAFDLTALGGPTILGLTVAAAVGFLLLHGAIRNAVFVVVACGGGWLLNNILKELFGRERPDVVPHLREVMTLSFPSGHALTSAVVFLTLGALLMRVVETRLAKFYLMSLAILATFLVGLTRVYLGVHYPTDVLAGWLIGMSWALACWLAARVLDRRAGLRRERVQTHLTDEPRAQ